MPRLTREQAREVDRRAIEAGIPGIVLMENAAINATGVILDEVALRATPRGSGSGPGPSRVVILCGGGNNGGDGYAIARHLQVRGTDATLYAASDPAKLRGDAATNHQICKALGFDIRPLLTAEQIEAASADWDRADAIVDALLGTGFHGEVREPLASLIHRVNRLSAPRIVAVDVPSGLDCDTGHASRATIRADATVTFVGAKAGFDAEEAKRCLGRVTVADIGVPRSFVEAVLAGAT